MRGRNSGQLMAAQGVADQNRCVKAKRLDNGEYILTQAFFTVPVSRMARGTVSPPRYAVNVTKVSDFGGELIEFMCRKPCPSQKYQPAPRPSPIEHFQTNIVVDPHELHMVRRDRSMDVLARA